jgi:hypothetical protein
MTELLEEAIRLLATARVRLQHEAQTHKETEDMEELEGIEATTTTTATPSVEAATLTPQVAGDMYVAGQSVIEIARAFGLTYAKTRKILAANGTEIRNASARLKGRPRAKKPASVDA